MINDKALEILGQGSCATYKSGTALHTARGEDKNKSGYMKKKIYMKNLLGF